MNPNPNPNTLSRQVVNVRPGSWLHLVHAAAAWAVTFHAFRLLWTYGTRAVALRVRHTETTPPGAATHSVLVTDVPGVDTGTFARRIDESLLRVLPVRLKRALTRAVAAAADFVEAAVDRTAGRVILGDADGGAAARRVARRDSEADRFYDVIEVEGGGAGGDVEEGGGGGGAGAGAGAAPAAHSRSPSPRRSSITLPPAAAGPSSAPRYEAVPPRGPAPAANRPPADDAPYVARTEIAAWPKAAAALKEGMSVHDLVASEFRALFPGQVGSVSVVSVSRRLAAAQAEYAAVTRALVDLCDDYTGKRRRRVVVGRKVVRVAGKKYGDWGKSLYGTSTKPVPVDALVFCVARADELRRTVLALRADPGALRAAPAAFVTFKSRRTAVLAATALLHHDVSAWNATAAPGPEEVIWGSLSLRAWERAVRGVVGWGGLIACAGAFLVPVVLIQSVLEIPRLRAIGAPWVEAVLTFPVVQSVTQCILPPFFLNLALYPAPWVIASLTRLAGPPSLFAVDVSVVQKHFAFLVIAVFFGSFVSGAVLNQLTMWTRHPAQAARILGTAIPLTSLFFLNFVEFCALAAAPFALLRAFGLAAFALKSRAASTERAKARLWQDQFADYGRTLPRHGLVALIGIVFAPITPLVPPMCLLYFVVASITEKYNLL